MQVKKSIREYNDNSLNELITINPFLVQTNPQFFDPDLMDGYGFQDFKIITENQKDFLYVDRYVIEGEQAVQLNTSVYAIDHDSVITHLVNNIKKKVRKMTPWRLFFKNQTKSVTLTPPNTETDSNT